MKKLPAPNYTQVPNLFLDNLEEYEFGESWILLVLFRHTFGWHKKKALLSNRRFMEITGLAKRTVQSSLHSLEKKGVISAKRTKEGTFYNLNLENFPELANSEEGGSMNDPQEGQLLTPAGSMNDPQEGQLLTPTGSMNDPQGGQPLTHIRGASIYKERKVKETIKENTLAPVGGGDSSISQSHAERATPKGSKKSKEPNPNHTIFIAQWCEAYAEHNRTVYPFEGGKDGSAAKRLLGFGYSPAELIALAKEAWKTRGNWDCGQAVTMAGFASRFAAIKTFLARKGIHPISESIPVKKPEPQEASAIELQW